MSPSSAMQKIKAKAGTNAKAKVGAGAAGAVAGTAAGAAAGVGTDTGTRPESGDPLSVVPAIRRKIEFARKNSQTNPANHEIDRITGLPVSLSMTDEEHEEYNRRALLAPAYREGFRLFHTQSDAVSTFEQIKGLFGPISVGWGKTLITLMCSNIAYTRFGVKKILLLAPSSVMSQLLDRDLKWARTRVPINYPIHVLHNKTAKARRQISHSGQNGVYIFPYSLLSAKDAADNLEAIDAGLIVCDEIQYIKDRRAARTKRIMEYVDKKRPLGVGLSGTITRKSISDYHHLIRWCLGECSPLPLSVSMASDWSVVLDADADPFSSANSTGPIDPLVHWAREVDSKNLTTYTTDRSGFRRAYKLRLTTCPGVVASEEAEIGVSLILQNEPIKGYDNYEGYNRLKSYIEEVEEVWATPNGDEIEHAIHKYKWLYELSAGFYNELIWPEPSVLSKRIGVPKSTASSMLERAKDHHEAHQMYAKRLRRFLQYEVSPSDRIDTPMLVGANMAAHGDRDVPAELYELWSEMRAADFEGRPERDSRAVRVCSYKVDAAVKWAQSLGKKGGIIWVYHREIGKWVHEKVKEAGLDCLHCPSGNESNKRITDPDNKDKIIVASIRAHNTGKNLQHFQHQYMLQWPRPAQDAEQLLGRTHRNGQQADELVVVTNNTLLFDQMNFSACLNDSLYIHQTTGSRQKLIKATYNPVPKMFPPEVLFERGIQIERLDREGKREMENKFGVPK